MTFDPTSLRPSAQRSLAIEAQNISALQGPPERHINPGQESEGSHSRRDESRGDDSASFSPAGLARAHQDKSVNLQTDDREGTEKLSQADERKLQALRQRDQEVRAHEQAHASAGGALTGTPKYTLEKGPDGNSYAVGGEVSISLKEGSTPEETLRIAQQAKSAALAPAQPSSQDQKVAARAQQLANKARVEQAQEEAGSQEDPQQTQAPGQKRAINQNAIKAYGPFSQHEEKNGQAISIEA